MAQQRNRKTGRVLLAVGAPLMVAVLGVSLGVAGGSAQADNGQPIILGADCPGSSGTNCEAGLTEVDNDGSGPAFVATATDGSAGLVGINSTNSSPSSSDTVGVYGDGAGAGDDGVFGNGQANGVKGETANSSFAAVVGDNTGGGDGVQGLTAGSGASGVYGDNTGGGKGVFGFSGTGNGVEGGSNSANGVQGETGASTASGVYGQNSGNGNGVFGYASNSAASGVYGQNDDTGYGVAGRAAIGTGVLGDSANGVGVLANSANAIALQVTGKAQFSRSGTATVAGTAAAPADSVRVSLPITGTSMMTATLQKFVAGVFVVAAVPNVSGGYFTIYLNKKVSSSVGPIAWIVTEHP